MLEKPIGNTVQLPGFMNYKWDRTKRKLIRTHNGNIMPIGKDGAYALKKDGKTHRHTPEEIDVLTKYKAEQCDRSNKKRVK
jgi:hypothetical protein